jgi:methylmalonyl-CoA mutase N-terminal domain/subunit
MGLEELGEAAVKKFKNPRLNVVPQVLGAVRAYATIGEIHGIFRKTFGVFRGNQ